MITNAGKSSLSCLSSIDFMVFGWKGREKRGRPGLVVFFRYNVVSLFSTLYYFQLLFSSLL